jgi:alkanesulfonate monooxygenase SsuD/methylene tetrahydromethanopterin reductase-like flavin-dependent oxidoreductase (luciferase family)
MGLVNFFRGKMGGTAPPVDDIEAIWSPQEKATIEAMNAVSIIGSGETVKAKLKDFIAATKADEVMVAGNFYEASARVTSLTLIRDALA